MNNEKFTPGPWEVKFRPGIAANEASFNGKENEYIGMFSFAIARVPLMKEALQKGKANANLIAAAPDMYEALKITYELLSVGQPLGNDDLDKIHVALSKANPQPITEV